MTTATIDKLLTAAKETLNCLTRLALSYGYIMPVETTDEMEAVMEDLSEAIEESE